MKNSLHLQCQLTCKTKHILGNKLLHEYSYVDHSQNYQHKYCSINCINSKFLKSLRGARGSSNGTQYH